MLTPQEAESLFETLRVMAAEGRTVIFISHKLHEVKAVSDRVTVLRAGKNVATVDTADSTPRSLASLMVGRDVAAPERRARTTEVGEPVLEVRGLSALGDRGGDALRGVTLTVARRRDRRDRGRRRQRPARARRDGDRDAPRVRRLGRRRGQGAARRRRPRGDPRAASRTSPKTGCTPASRPSLSIASNVVAQGLPRPRRVTRRADAAAARDPRARRAPDRAATTCAAAGPSCRRAGSRAATCRRSCSAREFEGEPARARRRLADARARRLGDRDRARVPARRGRRTASACC